MSSDNSDSEYAIDSEHSEVSSVEESKRKMAIYKWRRVKSTKTLMHATWLTRLNR